MVSLLLILLPSAWIAEPQAPSTPAAAVARAIHVLKAEVRDTDAPPPRDRCDFFSEFPYKADAGEAARRIVSPQASDDHVDAYVRWQLTAIADPTRLPEDRRFEQLLKRLPKLPTNPLSDERIIRRFEQEAFRKYPTEKTVETAMEAWQQEHARAKEVEAWARPGRTLREWLINQSPGDPERLDAGLEACHAEIASGWDPQWQIRRLDRLCAEIGDRQGLDVKQLEAFNQRARQLVGVKRPLAMGATGVERTFSVEVGYVAVRDYDVNRWIKLLRYGTPP